MISTMVQNSDEDKINQLLQDLKSSRCKSKTTCCKPQSEEQMDLIDKQIRFDRNFKKEIEECQTKIASLEEKAIKKQELGGNRRNYWVITDDDNQGSKEKDVVECKDRILNDRMKRRQKKKDELMKQARKELVKRRFEQNKVKNDPCCSII